MDSAPRMVRARRAAHHDLAARQEASTTKHTAQTSHYIKPSNLPTASPSSINAVASDTSSSKGHSGGAVAGIVILVLLLLAAAGVGAWWVMRRKKLAREMQAGREQELKREEEFASVGGGAGRDAEKVMDPGAGAGVGQRQSMERQEDPFASPYDAAAAVAAAKEQMQDIRTVIRPFHPTMDDELSLELGDKVLIKKEWDDGWCLGVILADPFKSGNAHEEEINEGVVPKDCLSPPTHTSTPARPPTPPSASSTPPPLDGPGSRTVASPPSSTHSSLSSPPRVLVAGAGAGSGAASPPSPDRRSKRVSSLARD